VNETIDTARLGTAGKDFINGKTYTVDLPKWKMSGMSLQYSDLHLFRESVIVPMSFVKSN
jgi:phosphate starvation-inducible protein PhoH